MNIKEAIAQLQNRGLIAAQVEGKPTALIGGRSVIYDDFLELVSYTAYFTIEEDRNAWLVNAEGVGQVSFSASYSSLDEAVAALLALYAPDMPENLIRQSYERAIQELARHNVYAVVNDKGTHLILEVACVRESQAHPDYLIVAKGACFLLAQLGQRSVPNIVSAHSNIDDAVGTIILTGVT